MYTPVHPSFTIQKWGIRWYSLPGLVFVMILSEMLIQERGVMPYHLHTCNNAKSGFLMT